MPQADFVPLRAGQTAAWHQPVASRLDLEAFRLRFLVIFAWPTRLINASEMVMFAQLTRMINAEQTKRQSAQFDRLALMR